MTADGQASVNDLVQVSGSPAGDVIVVDRTARTVVLAGVTLTVNAASESLLINGGLGDDTFTVSGSGGPALTIEGGGQTTQSPGDTLSITNTTGGTTTVTPGATSDAGTINTPDTANNTSFVGIEAITLAGAVATDDLVVLGTNANDTIAALNNGANRVWVNDRAPITFSSFDSLNLAGRFGSDTFSVTPIAAVAITVDGDDSAADSLVVHGQLPIGTLDTVTITPTGAAAGTVSVTGFGLVTFNTTESLTYNGHGGNDLLTFSVPVGTITYTPGATPDAATVQADSLVPIAFANLGSGGQTVQFAAGAGSTLIYQGTEANDAFAVLPGVPATDGRVTLNGQLPVETSGVTTLTLNGFDGDDTFTVTSGHPYTSITLAGGNPSASDTATLNGDGVNDIVVNLSSPSTVTGGGLGTVSLPGIEHATVNAATRNVTVNGTAGDDAISFTPTGAELRRSVSNRIEHSVRIGGRRHPDDRRFYRQQHVVGIRHFGDRRVHREWHAGADQLAARSRFVHQHRRPHGEWPRCQRYVRCHARCEHANPVPGRRESDR